MLPASPMSPLPLTTPARLSVPFWPAPRHGRLSEGFPHRTAIWPATAERSSRCRTSVRFQTKRLELFGCWFGAGRIVSPVEVSGDRQAGLSSGGANEVQDLLITVEWFACPVLGDLRKEAVFNGVPFGSASRVVGNGESQTERIGQLRLELGFPGAATIAIAAAGVAQNEELPGAWIAARSLLAPPMRDGVGREGGCVMRDTHHDGP